MKRWQGSLLAVLALAFVTSGKAMEAFLGVLFPSETALLYPLASPLELFVQHAALTLSASIASAIIGFAAGTLAHFGRGSVKELVLEAGALIQTLPPVAVLAMLVPLMGFGNRPVFVALALYGILPVIHGTVAGLDSVPHDTLDAAKGLGMGAATRFFRIELPLALPAIAAGVRTSVVINVGTAAIGATMGAGGFGRPIMSGLVQFRSSYVVQGAVAASTMALALDWLLETVERSVTRGSGGSNS
jgi:osmoprotectant transport system permease protein